MTAMLRTALARVGALLVGRPISLPPDVLAAHPELRDAHFRTGGLPLRVGGWCLGQRTVAGITLWRTIWLARPDQASPALLLHELAHVRQFARQRTFPLRYCWQSLRHGYARNRYETEADAFAESRLASARLARAHPPWSSTPRPPS